MCFSDMQIIPSLPEPKFGSDTKKFLLAGYKQNVLLSQPNSFLRIY